MKPIDEKCLAKAINFIDSLQLEEKIKYSENMHQLQPHAFLTIIAMSQDGVSLPKLDHAINMLMVIHTVFYSTCKNLPIITRDMLQDALESNVAMLQSIERGWLTHDESVESYPEKMMLAYMLGYLKEHDKYIQWLAVSVPRCQVDLELTEIRDIQKFYDWYRHGFFPALRFARWARLSGDISASLQAIAM